MAKRGQTTYLLYHFFHPDDVISARLFSDLATELADAGQRVVAMPSIHSCHNASRPLPRREMWGKVEIFRVWRPALPQYRAYGRVLNALFMILGWSFRALWLPRRPGEVMIVGSDPIFAVLVCIPWRIFRPSSRIIHWCHDLYPDAAVEDGMVSRNSVLVRLTAMLSRFAYRRCNVIADLGPCMRQRMLGAAVAVAPDATSKETLVPWALVEPHQVPARRREVRDELFGPAARLGLLYSGNLGRAHEYEPLVHLARRLRDSGVEFCFAGRGVGFPELKELVQEDDTNVRFAGFAEEGGLEARLAAADVHLVSLRESWTGTVVPSKFFGAIAMGRPVLFSGDEHSCVAIWIRQFGLGWVLSDGNQENVARELIRYAIDPAAQVTLQQRCFDVYRDQFSRTVQIQKWLDVVNN